MDAAKVFVLLLTVFAVCVLVYLELKSRRSRQGSSNPSSDRSQLPSSEADQDTSNRRRKH